MCVLVKYVMVLLWLYVCVDVVVVMLDDEDDEGWEVWWLWVMMMSVKSGMKKMYEMYEVMDVEYVDVEIDVEVMLVKVVSRAKTLLTLLAYFSSAVREDVMLMCGIELDVCVDGDVVGVVKIVMLLSYLSLGGGLS